MSEDEKKDWDELYQYIKKSILKYNDNLRLPKYFILRLKGLNEGKFISSKSHTSLGNYSFKEILITFKICKIKIEYYLCDKSKFADERHMVNGIMCFVEEEINNVCHRIRNVEKVYEKIEEIEKKEDSIEYKKREKTKTISDKLKDLW